jgi:O-antigen/teichoic acid export membrane protein
MLKKILVEILNKIKSFKNHGGFMKYFNNISWLFAEKILRLGVGLFVSIWIARYLGPDKYGLFNYSLSFVGLFTTFATLGLDGIVVREILKDNSKKDVLLGTVFWLKFISALLVLLGFVLFLGYSTGYSLSDKLILILASATLFQSFNVIDLYFQSKVLSKYVVYSNIISLLATSIIKICLIISNAPLVAFAWVVLFDSAVLAFGLIYHFIKINSEIGIKIKNWKFNKDVAISLLRDSLPMIFSGLAVSFYMKIDQIMVKEYLNDEAVGFYSAAVRLSEIWIFITIAITKSLYPAIISAKKISEELYYSRLKKMYQILVLVAVLISLGVTIFAENIVHYTFGKSFYPAINILVIYVWSNVFVFLNNGSWNWYVTENLQHLAAIRLFIGALVNFVLNLFLIKIYGLKGAAIATIISYSIASYFGNLISKKTRINFKMQTHAIFNLLNIKSYLK